MNKEKMKKILYIFIILNAFLDMLVGRVDVFGFSLSLSSLLRLIIPFSLIIYIFFKDKDERKKIFILGLVFLGYSLMHLYLYEKNLNAFAYGNTFYEATYLLHYIYLIFCMYLFYYVFKDGKNELYKYLFIFNIIYIVSLYMALITNTSEFTYIEGIGYKGWFSIGGTVGGVLVLSLFLLLPYIFKDKKNIILKSVFLISNYLYLIFILGTRVGMYGSILTLIVYVVSLFLLSLIQKIKFNKKILLYSSISLIIVFIVIYNVGSMAIEKRKMLENWDGKNPVEETDEPIYMAYDFILLKEDIEKGNIQEGFISDEQIDAIVSLDKYTTKNKTRSTDLRKQQLLYHYYLYKNQKSIALKLFGNGYLANMGALTLEMEMPALLFNFGLFGLILFFCPFLIILVYSIILAIKNIKKIKIEFVMLIMSSFMSMAIAYTSGHTYFNTSVMLVLFIINTLLLIETQKLRGVK